MALFSDVERKSFAARMIYLGIYTLLILGSITMIYPLLIMISSSVSSEVDYEKYHMLPYYIWDQDLLWQKYLGLKYDKEFTEFQHRYRIKESVGDFRYYQGKYEKDYLDEGKKRQVKDWNEFKKQLPTDRTDAFFTDKWRMGPVQEKYHKWLGNKFGTIMEYNQHFDPPENFRNFTDVFHFVESLVGHNWPPVTRVSKVVWDEFKKEALEPEEMRALSITHEYQKYLSNTYKADIEKLNKVLGSSYESFYDADFSSAPPENEKAREEWKEFVHTVYPMRYARIPGDLTEEFKQFILSLDEFNGESAQFNKVARQSLGVEEERDFFNEIQWKETIPATDLMARLWTRFTDSLPPGEVEYFHLHGDYREFLEGKYSSLDEVNVAYGASFQSVNEIVPPYKAADMLHFEENKGWLKNYFLFGNYYKVLSYIFTNGFALKNTIILVVFWVLGTLTVQPMAAYALSRFNLSYSNKILIFLIATMSFPHSVTMIPNFLLLKELHLLNTYAALILPHLIQGMGIFLLKGYFDSLPRELYEAAMIDGAGEFQMFRMITLPLSMPILAVIGLTSFTHAYGSFMWAFLICQKETMWTLMVFLYQFKQLSPSFTHMAALVIAGLPTLIVFIFAQKIIMRGIVIPTMK